MAASPFSDTKKFYGVTTVDVQQSNGTSIIGWTGLKASTLEVSVEQKAETIEFEDGSEATNKQGWTGSAKLSIGQLDNTDLQTLEDNAPGLGTSASKIKVTFTERGTGTNYTVTVSGLASLKVGLATGTYWKQLIEYGISAAASAMMHDFIAIAHA